ncbi:MAG TPA: glycosyltransferase [Burkholderiaceae bacterium]|nr:glycosyltransferase [Burkholderiaceae bacterium]
MIGIILIAFAVSAAITLLVIASAHRHERWSADQVGAGPQKMHVGVVPRVGGLGIACGMLLGGGFQAWLHPEYAYKLLLLFMCAFPTVAFGLIEDFTKSVSPRRRMLAAALSGLLGALLLDAVVVRTGWPWFDALLAYRGFALAATIFTVAGVVNSINIIDGMNGLASMCMALIMTALCYIALQVGDLLVAGVALATLGASLGFFIWNYPRGLIFLGDGGAYLLGLIYAELGIMLIWRNPEVSPLTPLVLVAYPVFETLFTMYRRKVLRGRPVSLPDGIHLHTLIYRRMMRWAVGTDDPAALTRGNSMTSPYLWVLSSLSVAPAAIWWDSTPAMGATLLVFVVAYVRLYWNIVRFKTPGWMGRLAGKS